MSDQGCDGNVGKESQPGGAGIGRRAVLKGLLLTAGSAGIGSAATTAAVAKEYPKSPDTKGDRITASGSSPIVETNLGKVRGYIRSGIFTFKGIPYGDTTAGDKRFMAPQRPRPWPGIRSSMAYGLVCPQTERYGWQNDEESWLFIRDDGIAGEDCLRVNIWTPGIADGKKRPVMVWLHGGGYSTGSGQELPAYDGENLARRGDVVVVTLNHRLNAFGHLDLSQFGSQYSDSANVGMLDIVLALQWVRDNIAEFGGDPGLVTIFGQSGGGGKVCTLMTMPSAEGLFHRCIVQSGSWSNGLTQEQSARISAAFLKQLQLDASSIGKLRDLPARDIVNAAVAASAAVSTFRPGSVINFRRILGIIGWAPVQDGRIVVETSFDPRTPERMNKIPLLVGNVLNEFTSAMNHPEYWQWTDADLQSHVREAMPEKADAIIRAAKDLYPNANPFQIWSITTATSVRGAALAQAASKAARGGAPAYCYHFTWQTPVLDGRPMACHSSEIAFVFNNPDRAENFNGGGPAARALADKMSDAWIHFARSGNPSHPGLPKWPEFSAAKKSTMVFDTVCAPRDNYDDTLQKITDPVWA
jgi:para-nitrobenzyl esterase